jgi:hypothetical protein
MGAHHMPCASSAAAQLAKASEAKASLSRAISAGALTARSMAVAPVRTLVGVVVRVANLGAAAGPEGITEPEDTVDVGANG